jgi:glycerophosphoryl diester phosphodiesterase
VWRKLAKWSAGFLLALAVLVAALYVYLASSAGAPAAEKQVFDKKGARRAPLVFAHRGGGGLYPENTLEAFEYSARMGADVLELDVHQTRDGALVVLHDRAVDRTTNGRGRVSDLTLEELKKLDAGFQFSPDGGQSYPFRGREIKIPTLNEVFDALPKMIFNIEPKQQTPSIVQPLCAVLRERKMTNQSIVGSFNQTTIDDFRRACPEVATAASPAEASRFLALYKTGLADSYSPPMQALQIPQTLGGFAVVSKDFIEAAHRRNLQVHVWTINDEADMRKLIDAGADGIMTDYPDKLLKLLDR